MKSQLLLCSAWVLLACVSALGETTPVPHQFSNGQVADAEQVNENFRHLTEQIAALQQLLDDQQSRIVQLESSEQELTLEVAALTSRVDEVESKTQFIAIANHAINKVAGPHMIIEGCNVWLRSGLGSTDTPSSSGALGNLILGYLEEGPLVGTFDRTGVHNLVMGTRNRFVGYGGIVAGVDNEAIGGFASVLGGRDNVAEGPESVTIAGRHNRATAQGSVSIAGGGDTIDGGNLASGKYAVSIGGQGNQAIGEAAVSASGSFNRATGLASFTAAGGQNLASGAGSAAIAGSGNEAAGWQSQTSAGRDNIALGVASWVMGLTRVAADWDDFVAGDCFFCPQ